MAQYDPNTIGSFSDQNCDNPSVARYSSGKCRCPACRALQAAYKRKLRGGSTPAAIEHARIKREELETKRADKLAALPFLPTERVRLVSTLRVRSDLEIGASYAGQPSLYVVSDEAEVVCCLDLTCVVEFDRNGRREVVAHQCLESLGRPLTAAMLKAAKLAEDEDEDEDIDEDDIADASQDDIDDDAIVDDAEDDAA